MRAAGAAVYRSSILSIPPVYRSRHVRNCAYTSLPLEVDRQVLCRELSYISTCNLFWRFLLENVFLQMFYCRCLANCGVKARRSADIAFGITCTEMCETSFGELSVVWRLFKVINSDTEELQEIPTDEFENMTETGNLTCFNHLLQETFALIYVHLNKI